MSEPQPAVQQFGGAPVPQVDRDDLKAVWAGLSRDRAEA